MSIENKKEEFHTKCGQEKWVMLPLVIGKICKKEKNGSYPQVLVFIHCNLYDYLFSTAKNKKTRLKIKAHRRSVYPEFSHRKYTNLWWCLFLPFIYFLPSALVFSWQDTTFTHLIRVHFYFVSNRHFRWYLEPFRKSEVFRTIFGRSRIDVSARL